MHRTWTREEGVKFMGEGGGWGGGVIKITGILYKTKKYIIKNHKKLTKGYLSLGPCIGREKMSTQFFVKRKKSPQKIGKK